MEIYKWVPLDRKRHLRAPLSTAASGTTTPVHGSSATKLTSGSLTVDSSNVTSKAPSTGYDTDSDMIVRQIDSDREIARMLSQGRESYLDKYVEISKRNSSEEKPFSSRGKG